MRKTLIIGAGGRVGYPFSMYCLYHGHTVYGYDIDPNAFERAKTYIEDPLPNGEPIHTLASSQNFYHGHDQTFFESSAYFADTIVIMIGTPVDSENNPRLEALDEIFDQIIPVLKRRTEMPVIILRSTVMPGTTNLLAAKVQTALKTEEGFQRCIVAFCPERISQGHAFTELPVIPQLIGVSAGSLSGIDGISETYNFFLSIGIKQMFPMSAKAAELGKLMTNMYRYVNFALANEFMQIADYHREDYESLRSACNANYPRMNLAAAGPNAAGPCLYKDGQFLVSHIPYVDIVKSSFSINEGMPEFVASKVATAAPSIKEPVAILGMAFKADNDDTRQSLSFKLKKILTRMGYSDIRCYDPLVYKDNRYIGLDECKVVVVMTPHSCFDKSVYDRIAKNTAIIDIWHHFPYSNFGHVNGMYRK